MVSEQNGDFSMGNTPRLGAPIATRLLLILTAAGIGLTIAILFSFVKSASVTTEKPMIEDLAIFFIHAATLSIPFVVLGIVGIRQLVPWLTGVFLTTLLWGYVLYDVIVHWDTDRGANIGLGLLILLSPFVITAVCLLIAWKWETRGSPEV